MAIRKNQQQASRALPVLLDPFSALKWWMVPTLFLLLLFVYGPALQGPPLFDDHHLPVFSRLNLPSWTSYFRGVRPLFYLSLHINYLLSGRETLWYHFTNVSLHFLNGCLIYFILCKLLELARSSKLESSRLSLVGACIFLFHPLQTEAVAYISSRSENLSALFAYGSVALFVGSVRNKIGWRRAILILTLLAAGVLTKEHVCAIVAVIFVIDWWANGHRLSFAIKERWKLYAPLALGAVIVVPALIVFTSKSSQGSAGFAIREFVWYHYLFTQFKVIWIYVRLFLVPLDQSIDYGLPCVQSLFEPLVLLGLFGLLGWLTLAWKHREKYPLILLGTLIFFFSLGPTSSFIPILDMAAERRAYLPSLGLLLILVEFLRHQRQSVWKKTLPWCVIALLAFGSWWRSHVFGSEIALWKEASSSRPKNARAWRHLGRAYVMAGRCSEASAVYTRAAALEKPDETLYVSMAAALYCDHDYARATNAYREAIALSPRAITWANLANAYSSAGQWAEARAALEEAYRQDPNCAEAYRIAAEILLKFHNPEEAAAAYRKAIELDPSIWPSHVGLQAAEKAVFAARQAQGSSQK